jgi:hypothetical protein
MEVCIWPIFAAVAEWHSVSNDKRLRTRKCASWYYPPDCRPFYVMVIMTTALVRIGPFAPKWEFEGDFTNTADLER